MWETNNQKSVRTPPPFRDLTNQRFSVLTEPPLDHSTILLTRRLLAHFTRRVQIIQKLPAP
jgi:hypothetical protein